MMQIVPGLDVRFSDVALVLLHCEHEVNFHDVFDDSVHSLDAVGSELSQGLRDLDVPSCDFHFHLLPPQSLRRRWCVLGILMSSRYLVILRRVTLIPSFSLRRSAIFSSVNGALGSSISTYFFTLRLTMSREVSLPIGPFTASEKK